LTVLSPDGRILARGGSRAVSCDREAPAPRRDTLELYDVRTGLRLGEPLSFPAPVKTVGFDPEGKRLGVGLEKAPRAYPGVATRRPANAWQAPPERGPPVPREGVLAWSADSRTCLVREAGGKGVRIYDAAARQPLFVSIVPALEPSLGAF